MTLTNEPTPCRVVSDYQSMYPDPIVIHTGDRLTVEERASEWAGWAMPPVPAEMIRICAAGTWRTPCRS